MHSVVLNGGGGDSMVNAFHQMLTDVYLCDLVSTSEIRRRVGRFIAGTPSGPFLAFDSIEACISSEKLKSCAERKNAPSNYCPAP